MSYIKKIQSGVHSCFYKREEECNDEEKQPLDEKNGPQPRPKAPTRLPWIMSTFAFACLSLLFYLRGRYQAELGTYELGFKTDFGKSIYNLTCVAAHLHHYVTS